MDVLEKLNKILSESDYDIRQAKQKALGLEHIAFDKFKDKQGNIYISDGPNFKKVGHTDEEIPGPFEVVPAKHWRNKVTGSTASVHGASPYVSDKDKENWEVVNSGWTVYNRNENTYGVGKHPWATREAALSWANKEHNRLRNADNQRLAHIEKLAKDQVTQMQSAVSEEEAEEIYNQNDRYVKQKIRELMNLQVYKTGKINWIKTMRNKK